MVENMCRVCLVSEEEENSFKNLQIPYKANDKPISIIFTTISMVQYSSNDGLPQKICAKCLNELLACYEFKKKCIKSDTEIRKILENHIESIETIRNDQLKIADESIIKIEIDSVHSDDEKLENNCENIIEPINNIDESEIERPNPKNKRKNCYKCEICYKIFDRKYFYNRHIKSHKPEEVLQFECDICNCKFEMEKNLLKHLKENHLETNNSDCYACPYCPRKFLKNVSRAAHIKYHKLRRNDKANTITKTSYSNLESPNNTEVKTDIRTLEFNDYTDKEYMEETSQDVVVKEKNNSNENLMEIKENINDNIDEVELPDTQNKRNFNHKCELCLKIFVRKYHLQRHMSVHNPEGQPFECDVCKLRFASQKTLTTHKMKHNIDANCIKNNEMVLPDPKNNRNLIHKCELCFKIFVRKYHLQRHMSVHNPEGQPFECAVCKLRFASQKTLTTHEMKHNIETNCIKNNEMILPDPQNKINLIHKCELCFKIFVRKYHLQRHMSVHNPEGQPFECAVCKWRFATQKSLTTHEMKHIIDAYCIKNIDTVSKCPHCPRKFAKKESLALHMRVHESKMYRSEKPENCYKCQFCSKSFNQIISLTKHLFIHDDKTDFNCNFCDKTFALPEELIEHLKWHQSTHLFQCKICTKSFNRPSSLKDHMRSHSGEKPYLCSECGKGFYHSSTLKQHIIRHSGDKPYECVQCPSRFAFMGDLKSHMNTHIKLKPYACDSCGSKFTKRSSLNKHNLVHTGERPYQCTTCDMKFTRSSHLKRHTLIHTGEKPYSCKYCGKEFVQSNDLVKHLKIHLGDKIYKCCKCNESFRLQGELRDHLNAHYRKEKQVMGKVDSIDKGTKEEKKINSDKTVDELIQLKFTTMESLE